MAEGENVIDVDKMFDWLKRLFRRKQKEIFKRVIEDSSADKYDIGGGEYGLSPKRVKIFIRKAGNQATRQDISKFISHGKQSPLYRKSVKAKVQPEED